MSKNKPERKNRISNACPLCTKNQQCLRCQVYERFPKWRWLQAIFTSVMGDPHVGQVPIFKHTKLTRLIAIFAVFYGSVITTCLLVILVPMVGLAMKLLLMPAIVASILISSGMARSMSMFILHYAAHGSFSGNIGEFSSMSAMSLSFDEYVEKHLSRHHARLTSKDDPDQQTIAALGFVPGMSFNYYIRHLLRVLVSPHYFWLHLRGRLDSQFSRRHSSLRRVVAAAIQLIPLLIAITTCFVFDTVIPLCAWAIAWVLPLTYGTYVSMIFFSLGLHRWFSEEKRGLEFQLSKTGGRFFGDPLPRENMSSAKRYAAWGLWWIRFLILHLLIGKLFIMGVSDSQQHDAHHRFASGNRYEWFNGIYSRYDWLVTSNLDRERAWNTWGSVLTAILLNFERMSKLGKRQVETTIVDAENNFLRTDM